MSGNKEIPKKRAPTLWLIIGIKLIKGLLFAALALAAYTLSDNDLPAQYKELLQHLKLNPERKFWADLAVKIGQIHEKHVLVAAAGTFVYSMFSLVEGIGLMFRIAWAGYMAIGESAFFIPIEIFELIKHFSLLVFIILCANILIVWYLYQNRHRLFRQHS
jgi:uncharacterized membrane protein (DUF2068 family)